MYLGNNLNQDLCMGGSFKKLMVAGLVAPINIPTYVSIKFKTHCTCNLFPVDMVMLASDSQQIEHGMCMWFMD